MCSLVSSCALWFRAGYIWSGPGDLCEPKDLTTHLTLEGAVFRDSAMKVTIQALDSPVVYIMSLPGLIEDREVGSDKVFESPFIE